MTTKPRKPRKCKSCGEPFTPTRPMQPTCQAFDCLVKHAEKVAAKLKAKRLKASNAAAKVERKADRERLEELKPMQYFLKRTQAAVNALRRAQDLAAGHGCITCGTHDAEEWHAGHWISVGASSATRFDYANIHLQCRQCNYFGAGRAQEYEARLPARIGQAEVDRLKYAKRDRKWTREELQAIEAKAKADLRELKMSQP